jgi:hypothetical protein
VAISVGYGLEGVLTDALSKRIITKIYFLISDRIFTMKAYWPVFGQSRRLLLENTIRNAPEQMILRLV